MRLFADEPALDAVVTWAKRLTKLLRRRAVESLDDVLAAAAGTLFAGSRRAYVAIRHDQCRARDAMDNQSGRRADQPHQDAEAQNVWSGWVRAAPRTNPFCYLRSPAARGLRENQNAGANDSQPFGSSNCLSLVVPTR